MAGLLFAQGWACSSPKFAQPQAVKRLLFNPERAEAQSPAHLPGGIGPPGWVGMGGGGDRGGMGREVFPETIISQGFACRAVSKRPFRWKQDLPWPILSYLLGWLRSATTSQKKTPGGSDVRAKLPGFGSPG